MDVQRMIEEDRRTSRTLLTEIESKAILLEAGIPTVETLLARSKEESVLISKKLGFPVAFKVVSPEIDHKSDVGGVKLGLKTSKQVEVVYDDIVSVIQQKNLKSKIDGCRCKRWLGLGWRSSSARRRMSSLVMF